MNRLTALAERKLQLQLKAAAHRQQLGVLVESIETRTHAVDQVFVKIRPLLRKPVLIAAAAALVLFLGPRRALRLAGKALWIMSSARSLLGI